MPHPFILKCPPGDPSDVLPVVAPTNLGADRMTRMTPYAPAYPFPTSPSGMSGRLNAARRWHPEQLAAVRRAEDELVAARIAFAACRALTDLGRPLPADLADTLRALLTGEVDAK